MRMSHKSVEGDSPVLIIELVCLRSYASRQGADLDAWRALTSAGR